MRSVVLISCLTFLLSACATTQPEVKYIEKPVYIKCEIPEVPRAELQTIPENATYPEKLQCILNNYLKLQKENKMLREAIEVCK